MGSNWIKVTLLGLVDPAVGDNPGIDPLFEQLRDGSQIDDLLAGSPSFELAVCGVPPGPRL